MHSVRVVGAVVTRAAGTKPHRREHAHVDLLAGFRTRDPAVVQALVLRHLEDNEAIAQEAIAPVR